MDDHANSARKVRHATQLPSDIILDILKRESRKETGLFRLDVPTGVGKSYAAENLIGCHIANPENQGRKIIYLASQKKHLPKDEDIARSLDMSGLSGSEKPLVLRVQSNYDMLSSAMEGREIEDVVPPEFVEDSTVRSLWNAVRSVRQEKQSSNELSDDEESIQMRMLNDAMTKFELRWRMRLREEYERAYGTPCGNPSDLTRIVRGDARYAWLGKLYPTMFVGDARALILTYRKFLVNVRTLVDGPFTLHNSNHVNMAVIIMDEIDMSKGDVLDYLTEQSARHRTDIPSLGSTLCLSLMHSELPSDLFVGKRAGRARRLLASDKAYASRLYESHSLQFEYKAEEALTAGRTLFFDGHNNVALDNNVFVREDRAARVKRLTLDKGKGVPLIADLGGIFSLVRRLRKHTFTLATSRRNERLLVGEHALENELVSILWCLDIRDREQLRYLMNDFYGARSQMRLSRADAAELQDSLALSLYSKGLQCIYLQDSDAHAMSTEVTVSEMGMTPESFLASLAKRARVLGLSATATLDSVLSNYSEEYLRTRCPGGVDGVRPQDLARLKAALARRNQAYEDGTVQIRTTIIPSSYDRQGLEALVEGDCQQEAAQYLADILADSEDTYCRERYVRFMRAYCYFLGNESMQAMLALGQPAPKDDKKNRKFNQDTLRKLLGLITQSAIEEGTLVNPEAARDCVRFISSSRNFQKEFDEQIKPELEKGRRVFLIASYATLGTGVNLQFEASDMFETLSIDDMDMGGVRDFDGMYLDRPTHLAPGKGKNDAERTKCVFELCELAEQGEISMGERGRQCRHVADGSGAKNLKDCPSVRAKGTGIINQALGRLCRTNCKAPVIHIVMDEEIARHIDVHAMDGTLTNPEFKEAMTALSQVEEYKGSPHETRAITKTLLANRRIQSMISAQRWTEEHKRLWHLWREFVLTNPTYGGPHPESQAIVQLAYICSDQPLTTYTYIDKEKHEVEFRNMEISLASQRRLGSEVSADAAQLTSLVAIDEIASLFESKGWAKEWRESPYIMSPVFFKNIYLGALGEEIGRYLLERYVPQWAIDDIDEETSFEKFDARFRDTNVFIDFKHWAGPVDSTRNEIEHVKGKMEEVGASHVLICNLTNRATADVGPYTEYYGRILLIPYLVDVTRGCVATNTIAAVEEWLEKVAK